MARRKRRGRPPGLHARYKAIAEKLAHRLESGEWPVGKPLPPCRRLAREYGVGAKTIWRALKALKGDGRIRESPRRPPVAARRVPLSVVLEDAVVLVTKSGVADFIPTELGRGILRSLSKTRAPFVCLQDMRWWRYHSPEGLRELPLKGILIESPIPADLLKQYESMNVPVVLIDQPGDEYNLHTVTVANYEAAFDATSRLIEMEHKQIAFVRSVVESIKNIDPDSKERQEGFVAACKHAGLKSDQYGIFSANFQKGSISVNSLMRATPRFTAALCAGDAHAAQIYNAAKAAGRKIPRDLSVVTFRDTQEYPIDWSGPQIDFEEMGRIATELLQRGPRTIQHLRFKTEWHEGSTLAPPRR